LNDQFNLKSTTDYYAIWVVTVCYFSSIGGVVSASVVVYN